MNLKNFFKSYTLTEGQKELVKNLDEFLENNNFCFIIKGAAGTGKTFITNGLTKYLNSIGRTFRLAAPTGRAAKILSERTEWNASTIHAMIYSTTLIEEKKEGDDVTEEIKFYFQLRANNDSINTVYIIDEASMISDAYSDDGILRFGSGYLLRDLIEYIWFFENGKRRKLILIGDNCQLPPVNMNFSPALNKQYLEEKFKFNVEEFELTDVIRQDLQSGIIKNATRIRNALTQNLFYEIYVDTNTGDVESLEPHKFADKFLRIFNAYEKNETILIAYTNFQVKEYNQRLRELIWNSQCELRAGDRVLVVKNNNLYNLFNGEFCTVLSVGEREIKKIDIYLKTEKGKVEKKEVELKFRDISLKVDYSSNVINAKFLENFLYSDEPNLLREEGIALYVDFKSRHGALKPDSIEFKEELRRDPYFNALLIKFGYAVTCHKAQGGEWKNVFLNCRSPNGYHNSNYLRWLYTAITRAKEKVYTLYEPNFRVGTGLQKIETSPTSTFSGDLILIDDKLSLVEIPEDFSKEPEVVKYIFLIINEFLKKENVIIENIKHHQYAEHYSFSNGEEELRVIIYYNNKGKISRIQVVNRYLFEWMNRLLELLKRIEGKTLIFKPKDVQQLKDVVSLSFPEDKPYLKKFFEQLKQKCEEQGIMISNIEHKDYHEIYTFQQNDLITVVKFYYNRQGIFTRYEIIQKRSTGLIKGLEEILKKE